MTHFEENQKIRLKAHVLDDDACDAVFLEESGNYRDHVVVLVRVEPEDQFDDGLREVTVSEIE